MGKAIRILMFKEMCYMYKDTLMTYSNAHLGEGEHVIYRIGYIDTWPNQGVDFCSEMSGPCFVVELFARIIICFFLIIYLTWSR